MKNIVEPTKRLQTGKRTVSRLNRPAPRAMLAGTKGRGTGLDVSGDIACAVNRVTDMYSCNYHWYCYPPVQ